MYPDGATPFVSVTIIEQWDRIGVNGDAVQFDRPHATTPMLRVDD